jgi:hypothetical protein
MGRGPCPGNCFTEKHCSTMQCFRSTVILCAQGHFVKQHKLLNICFWAMSHTG